MSKPAKLLTCWFWMVPEVTSGSKLMKIYSALMKNVTESARNASVNFQN